MAARFLIFDFVFQPNYQQPGTPKSASEHLKEIYAQQSSGKPMSPQDNQQLESSKQSE